MATIEKRGKSYRITVSCGYDARGRQLRESMTWTPDPGMSEKKVRDELARQAIRFEDAIHAGVAGGHVKLSIFMDQYFRENSQLKERTRATYQAYRPRVDLALGHLYLDKITPRHIKAFLLNLAEEGVNQTTKGALSWKTIKNYKGFLSSVFAYAVDLDMIRDNPCRGLRNPGEKTAPKPGYTLEEAQALVDSLDGCTPEFRAYVILAVFCGYSRSELGGLEWADVDFSTQTIAIRRGSLYTKERGVYTDTPKTAARSRVQRQQPFVFDALRTWRAEQAERRLALGDQWEDTNRIFTGDFGRPIHPNTSYRWLKRHCEANGIRFLGVHALRHLNASLRISAGTDVRTVAAAMGHSQASTTLNIYAYEFDKVVAESSEAVADLLTAKRAPNTK